MKEYDLDYEVKLSFTEFRKTVESLKRNRGRGRRRSRRRSRKRGRRRGRRRSRRRCRRRASIADGAGGGRKRKRIVM